MSESLEWVLWTTLGVLVYAVVLQPAVVLVMAAVRRSQRRRRPGSEPSGRSRHPMVTVVTPVRLGEHALVERVTRLVEAAREAGRTDVVLAADPAELGYLRALLPADCRARLRPSPNAEPTATLLEDLANEPTSDALLLVPRGLSLTAETIRSLADGLGGDVGLVQCRVETTRKGTQRPWLLESALEARLSVAEADLGGRHRIGDGPFVVCGDVVRTLAERTTPTAAVDAATLSAALVELGMRMSIVTEAAAVTHGTSRVECLRAVSPAERLFGWTDRQRSRAARAAGATSVCFRLHERLRHWKSLLVVVAIAANIALATNPFYLRLLFLQQAFVLAALAVRTRGPAKPAGRGRRTLPPATTRINPRPVRRRAERTGSDVVVRGELPRVGVLPEHGALPLGLVPDPGVDHVLGEDVAAEQEVVVVP